MTGTSSTRFTALCSSGCRRYISMTCRSSAVIGKDLSAGMCRRFPVNVSLSYSSHRARSSVSCGDGLIAFHPYTVFQQGFQICTGNSAVQLHHGNGPPTIFSHRPFKAAPICIFFIVGAPSHLSLAVLLEKTG